MVVQTEPENEAAIEELFKLTEKNILTPEEFFHAEELTAAIELFEEEHYGF